MRNFYFTFGTDKNQPFRGGWVIVKARSMNDACEVFRRYFPDKIEDTYNCADIYSEKSFKCTEMYRSGNFGKRCHGIICFKALKNKDGECDEETSMSM